MSVTVRLISFSRAMPRCCSVSGCKSNYRSQNESVSTFALPKDENQRKIWLRKIPTDLNNIKNPVVCIKHFPDDLIIRTDKVIVQGEMKEFPRKIPKLKEGAFPCIFPNLPKYLSDTADRSKRLVDVEQSNFDKAILESLAEKKRYDESRAVQSLDDIKNHFDHSTVNEDIVAIKKENKLVFMYVSVDADVPIIRGSFGIDSDFNVTASLNNVSHYLPKHLRFIKNLNDFDEVLSYMVNKLSGERECTVEFRDIVTLLRKYVSERPCSQLSFLLEQLNYADLSKNNYRHSGDTLTLASLMYISSQSAYSVLYKSNLLYLPHPRNISKLISKFDLSDLNIDGSIQYLKNKLSFLKEHEMLINLHMDEIYVDPRFSFKGGSIYGSSLHDPSTAAKTAQVFMVSSILSKYKDIVAIIPISNLNAEHSGYKNNDKSSRKIKKLKPNPS